jgi:hypothetical protein
MDPRARCSALSLSWCVLCSQLKPYPSCRLAVAEFKKAYPEAKVIGVKDVAQKVKAHGLTLDGGKLSFKSSN